MEARVFCIGQGDTTYRLGGYDVSPSPMPGYPIPCLYRIIPKAEAVIHSGSFDDRVFSSAIGCLNCEFGY